MLAQYPLTARNQQFACLCQKHFLVYSSEEWSPDLLLEALDLSADGRLCQVHAMSSARKTRRLCYREEGSQLSQFHRDGRSV